MHCRYCGNEVADNASFCATCGKDIRDGPTRRNAYGHPGTNVKQKNLALGIILNLLIPGVGHMYAGKFLEGVIIFIFAMFAAGIGALFSPSVSLLLYLVVAAWAIYDVYKKINEYNEHVLQYGTPPW